MGMQMGMCMWTDYKSHGEDLTSSAAAIVNIRFISFLFGSGFIFSFYVRTRASLFINAASVPSGAGYFFSRLSESEKKKGWDRMGGQGKEG